jgi:aminopeptidase N
MCKLQEGAGLLVLAPHSHRLPKTVVPSRYELTLTPDLAAATFAGQEVIDIEVLSPVGEIIINASELQLTQAYVTDANGTRLSGTVVNGAGQSLDGSVSIADLKDDLELAITTFAGKLGKGKRQLHIAIPDFAFGAMENLGCITYRETALLVDESTATVGEKIRVAEVVAHEITNMWFGDLVTMKW